MRRFEKITGDEFEHLQAIFSQFAINGSLNEIHRLYQGHLHTTFVSSWIVVPSGMVGALSDTSRSICAEESSSKNRPVQSSQDLGLTTQDFSCRFLHQRVNRVAFPETKKMLDNTARIIDFLSLHPEYSFPARLSLVPSHSPDSPFLSVGEDLWRTYKFVEESTSYDNCPNVSAAFNLGRAAGEFLFLLSSLDGSSLHDHFPHFHHTPTRCQNLERAVRTAPKERLQQVESLLVQLADSRKEAELISEAVAEGALPQQIIHGDTKVNNFLFRDGTNEVLCLVDIDLCMLATPLYDFGDLVRSASVCGREDEPNLDQVSVNQQFISALTGGFIHSRYAITENEKHFLPLAPFTISFNLTARFLTDYLEGDIYFPVVHPEHNRDRAAAQFKVTQELYNARNIIADVL